jgi:hypothetical protein
VLLQRSSRRFSNQRALLFLLSSFSRFSASRAVSRPRKGGVILLYRLSLQSAGGLSAIPE